MDTHLESTVKEGLEQEMPRVHAGLRTFTHLRIGNIGRFNKEPFAGDFCRTYTFPAARTSVLFMEGTPPAPLETWEPMDVSELSPNCRLRLTLVKRIGEGGTSTVYSAVVRSPTNFDLPETVCVKVAKWSRNRSLAREAWYYEQLSREENCEGIATPRCFGFFEMSSVDPPEAVDRTIIPWKCLEYGDEEDILREDFVNLGNFLLDEHGLTQNSSWYGFTQDEPPTVCVLVLEELGAPYPAPLMDDEALRDIREILEDLAHIGIVHRDARYNNVLRSLVTDSKSLCSRHQRIHNWRLIDFDRSMRLFITESNPKDLSYSLHLQFEDFNKGQNSYFMRGIPS